MIPGGEQFALSGVHAINQYLWNRLSTQLGLDKTKTGNLIPIIPTQQVPQLTQYAEPFLVYNWVTDNQGLDWYFNRDVVIYKIYSEEEGEIRRILNFMRMLFERHDESAQTVNEYLRVNSDQAKYGKFHFKYIKVGAEAGGIEPSETEAGRQEATVVLNVMYTVEWPEGMR